MASRTIRLLDLAGTLLSNAPPIVITPDRVSTGNRDQTAAPVGIFRTRDGWILAQVIGHPRVLEFMPRMGRYVRRVLSSPVKSVAPQAMGAKNSPSN